MHYNNFTFLFTILKVSKPKQIQFVIEDEIDFQMFQVSCVSCYDDIINCKLEINVIDKLEELEYNIKFVDELDQYKEIKNKLTNNQFYRCMITT